MARVQRRFLLRPGAGSAHAAASRRALLLPVVAAVAVCRHPALAQSVLPPSCESLHACLGDHLDCLFSLSSKKKNTPLLGGGCAASKQQQQHHDTRDQVLQHLNLPRSPLLCSSQR